MRPLRWPQYSQPNPGMRPKSPSLGKTLQTWSHLCNQVNKAERNTGVPFTVPADGGSPYQMVSISSLCLLKIVQFRSHGLMLSALGWWDCRLELLFLRGPCWSNTVAVVGEMKGSVPGTNCIIQLQHVTRFLHTYYEGDVMCAELVQL